MPLVHGSYFAVNLESDHIILHGAPEESAGVILRGSVVLNCNEATKIKSLTLKLEGKTKVNWTEGHGSHQRHYKHEKTIIEHTWTFMELKRKPHQLSEGRYKWDFELPLPGDLPGTVQHDLGQVYYRLKAVAERPAFSMNYVAKRNLTITRLMLPSSLEFSQSVVISNEWTGKISYNISIPRKVYSCGTSIPITFDLVPIAPGLSVRAIACHLKEYAVLSTQEHSRTEGRVIKTLRDARFSGQQDRWIRKEVLYVPSQENRRIQSDTCSDLIRIKHKLKFTVCLVNEDGHISELRAAVPIILASVAPEEDANELPAYEDAWKSLPYDPNTIAALISSGDLSASGFSRPPTQLFNDAGSTSGSSSSEDEGPLPWEGFDLTRVPSYSTALRTGRQHSFSGPSLPPYESLVSVTPAGNTVA